MPRPTPHARGHQEDCWYGAGSRPHENHFLGDVFDHSQRDRSSNTDTGIADLDIRRKPISKDLATRQSQSDLTGHVIASLSLLATDSASGTELGACRQILRRGILFTVAFLCSSFLNIYTGDTRVPLSITCDAGAASAVAADHIAVVIGKALLAGIAFGYSTTLELGT